MHVKSARILLASLLLCGCGEDDAATPETVQDAGAQTTGTDDVSEGADADDVPTPSTDGCAALQTQCVTLQQGCVGAVEGIEAHCALCPVGMYPSAALAQCETLPGTPLTHRFEDLVIPSGGEESSLCLSWFLNNPEEIWVNTVEFENAGWFHHSNWFFVPQGTMGYSPDESWYGCGGEGFDENAAAVVGGVVFAQSTQIAYEVQYLPTGTAIRIPPYSRIIGAVHLLNYGAEAQTTHAQMTLHTMKKAEVETPLTPFRLTYSALTLPPKMESEFTGECDLREDYSDLTGKDLDISLYYALPHFHGLGTSFSLEVLGGEKDGDVIFEQSGFGLDPYGRTFAEPIDLTGAHGIRFSCGYFNPREESVGWGIGDQEMCVMLGFVSGEMAFSAVVSEGTVLTDMDSATPETVVQNAGPCSILSFPFDPNKGGGLPLE
jgi:hypothetical protein